MKTKRSESRLYQKRGRYYADLRDLGGALEALRPPAKEPVRLARYAALHLRRKAEDREVTPGWLATSESYLKRAIAFFGAGRDCRDLTAGDMGPYVDWLRQQPNGREGGKLSEGSVRKHLNTLSNLFRRAASEGLIAGNPIANMYSKPTASTREADYLEPEEAASLLEAARTYVTPFEEQGACPYMYPLLATFLLTGMRKSEVFGLEVDDVSLTLGKIYLRPNEWRRLKTKRSKRTIPLWPQLHDILVEYFAERERTGGLGRLLFGSARSKEETMISDVRKALDRIGSRAKFPEGHIRLHKLRHTYTAARIQTVDQGVPVALFTIARELGHSSTEMIETIYGHLHDRAASGGSEAVEFRVRGPVTTSCYPTVPTTLVGARGRPR